MGSAESWLAQIARPFRDARTTVRRVARESTAVAALHTSHCPSRARPMAMVISRATLLRRSSFALTLLLQPRPQPVPAAEPSAQAVQIAKGAFQAFDGRNLPLAEELFSKTIDEWRRLDRGVEELTSLLVARAGVRTDRTQFQQAKADLDEAIALMAPTGEKSNGVAAYREYPDAFVQRGLAREGLRDWSGALADYDRAVRLWGGDGSDGLNPFALSYRGRAKSEVGDMEGALQDFRQASDLFSRVDKNDNQASAARANEAITLYGLGRRDEAVRIAKQVVTRVPGFTDLRVLLAADAWDRGDDKSRAYAVKEWRFACDTISSGCQRYRDTDGWLTEVRRWPTELVRLQRTFLDESKDGMRTTAGM